jgi:preprotein translocase subunit SecE
LEDRCSAWRRKQEIECNTVFMNSRVETPTSGPDTIKLWAAALLVVAALVAFYYFADASVLVRVLGLLAAVVIAGLIGYQTEPGRHLVAFLKDAQIEVRKVVWPTRDETVKTTLTVVVVVIAIGVALWLLDMLIGWLVQLLTSIGG